MFETAHLSSNYLYKEVNLNIQWRMHLNHFYHYADIALIPFRKYQKQYFSHLILRKCFHLFS